MASRPGPPGRRPRPPAPGAAPAEKLRGTAHAAISSAWVPVGHHPAAVDHHHPVGQGDGGRRWATMIVVRPAMSRRRVAWMPASTVGVDGRRGVVEHQDPGVGEQGAGQGDALALASRKREAPLPHHRVVTRRQHLDELVGFGRLRRGPHLLVGGVRAAVGDVVPDGGGEQEGVFEDHPDAAAQIVEAQVGHVHPVERDGAGVDVVEAGQEQGHGGLARSRRPDQGHPFTGPDPQAEPVEERRSRTGAGGVP